MLFMSIIQVNEISTDSVPMSVLAANTLNMTVSVNAYVPAQQCLDTQFLCVLATRGHGALYVDPYQENSMGCSNISEFLICQPGRYNAISMFKI